ncbi:clathrin light chain isoform X2 [Nilaparvata lugens]|uniref:clathrin light chain isoform X2 n=1 Tax=Nilaparvata lugens TaxID=108931 RepID=UPI00193E94D3|nr:clathrin light chain isoform X2 [Nilaparvata lugens]XP_039294705.1 clathrin light chain isoform X2 [Nilaparvata lugens]XP_039294706.1 clathrin light chain isoform X2 [Nilaparvata lugens]XP_039294707.1 clathrin light chain isoform X2 [Nilaparvata lugens]
MDGFNDNFDETEVDPAAEFLAREQDDLAGLEDEMKPAVPTPVVNGGTHLEATESSGSFEMINSIGQNEVASNDTPTPANVVTNGQDAVLCPTSAISSSSSPPPPTCSSPSLSSSAAVNCLNEGGESSSDVINSAVGPHVNSSPLKTPVVREEPEKIKKWREDQKKSLEEKDLNEEKKKEELRTAAKSELDEWYRHHEELIAKTRAANRNAEKQFVAESGAIEPGTEWERIAKLCDFNPKSTRTSKDVSRMRSIILQLKQNPPPNQQPTTAKQG